jgi:hypothetical protein
MSFLLAKIIHCRRRRCRQKIVEKTAKFCHGGGGYFPIYRPLPRILSSQKIRELTQKESTCKKSVYLPPILENYVYEYG